MQCNIGCYTDGDRYDRNVGYSNRTNSANISSCHNYIGSKKLALGYYR
jgi:hypothetical protein